jgi:predicted nucleotidyltransferase
MAQRDYEEFFGLLNANGVKFLIVGAHAVAFYARPRATKDIDILHEATEESAVRILKAIRAFFGGYDLGLTIDDLCNPDLIVQLGVAPVRIDLMGSISGISSFEDVWSKRETGKYGEADVSYISLDDLIRNKEKANREQDKADLKYLRQAKASKRGK